MANHDRYENDILKQLTRIANALERIEKANQLNLEIMPANELKDHLDRMARGEDTKPSDVFSEE